jgi:hypothetical protein
MPRGRPGVPGRSVRLCRPALGRCQLGGQLAVAVLVAQVEEHAGLQHRLPVGVPTQ